MFGKEKPAKRFVLKESCSVGTCGVFVICDTKTGVNYLASGGDGLAFSSITPLLDHSGNVVIDPTGSQY